MSTAGCLFEAATVSSLSVSCSRICHPTTIVPKRANWKVDTQAIARRRRHWKTSKQRGASISARENPRRVDDKTSSGSNEGRLDHSKGDYFNDASLPDDILALNLSLPPPEARDKQGGPASADEDGAGNSNHGGSHASIETAPATPAMVGCADHGIAGAVLRGHPLQEAAMQYAVLADTLWDSGHGDGPKASPSLGQGKKGTQAQRAQVAVGSISDSSGKEGGRGETQRLRQGMGMGMPPQAPQGLPHPQQEMTAAPSSLKSQRRVPPIHSTSEWATRHTGASEDRAEAAQRSTGADGSSGDHGGLHELPPGHPLRALYGVSEGNLEEILSELDLRESVARSQGMSLVELQGPGDPPRDGTEGGGGHLPRGMRGRAKEGEDEQTFVNRTKGEFLRQRLQDMSQALSSVVYPPRSNLPPSPPPGHELSHLATPPGHPLAGAPHDAVLQHSAPHPSDLSAPHHHAVEHALAHHDVRDVPGHPLGRGLAPMDTGAGVLDAAMASRHLEDHIPGATADSLGFNGHATAGHGAAAVTGDTLSVGSIDTQVDSVLARLAQAQLSRQGGGVEEYTEANELPESYGERELKLAMEMARVRQEMARRDQDFELLRGVLKEAKAKLKKLKSTTMAEIARAQATLKEQDRRLAAAEASLSQMARVTFEWKGHASRVQLAGAFDGWTHFIDLTKEAGPDARGDSFFAIELRLYPGTYECKFLVDGQWMIDKTKEVVKSGNNENNLVRVIMPTANN